MNTIRVVDFREWFEEKFYLWRGRSTQGPTAFARYLGITQQYVSAWLAGKYQPKSAEHIAKLADKYPDVYEVLGIESLPLSKIPPDLAGRLRSALSEIANTLAANNIDPDSDEATRVANSIMPDSALCPTILSIPNMSSEVS